MKLFKKDVTEKHCFYKPQKTSIWPLSIGLSE